MQRPSVTSLSILVAEDNRVFVEVMRRMLSRLSCTASFVGTGEAAIAAVASGAFDVVFLDLRLPDQSGIETAKRIRELKGATLPYLVALSASEQDEDVLDAAEAGVDEFITKPITTARLREALDRAMGRKTSGSLPAEAPEDEELERWQLEEIARAMTELQGDFLRRLVGVLGELELALPARAQAAPRELATRHLHSLAGTSGSLGFAELGEVARVFEAALRRAAPDAEVAALWRRLKDSVEHALAAHTASPD